MSFETTTNFLTSAASSSIRDSLDTPSARIASGLLPRVGTGVFSVLQPLPLEAREEAKEPPPREGRHGPGKKRRRAQE